MLFRSTGNSCNSRQRSPSFSKLDYSRLVSISFIPCCSLIVVCFSVLASLSESSWRWRFDVGITFRISVRLRCSPRDQSAACARKRAYRGFVTGPTTLVFYPVQCVRCPYYTSTIAIEPAHLIQRYVYLTVSLVHNVSLLAIKTPLQSMPPLHLVALHIETCL